MKYWGIAKKLQLLAENKNVGQFDTTLKWIFWIGVVFNSFAGLLFIGYPIVEGKWFRWFVLFMQACIFVSCGILIDAFRILDQQKEEHQIISKKLVTLLSIAFGAFGISVLVTYTTRIWQQTTLALVSNAVTTFIFLLSCLILTYLLSNLTEMQGAQHAHNSVQRESLNRNTKLSEVNFELEASEPALSESQQDVRFRFQNFDELDEQIFKSVFEDA